jgi:hypothetical protein
MVVLAFQGSQFLLYIKIRTNNYKFKFAKLNNNL